MYSKLVLSVLTALLLAIVIGCSEPTHCKFDFDESIQIVTGAPNDTLFFLPHDSASTTVTVIVTDESGDAIPGQKVDISLSDPSLGVIEFIDDALMDTTNSVGRVNAIFRSYAIEGQLVITASTGGLTDTDTLRIREFDFTTFTAEVTLNVDTVNVNQWVQPILQMRVLSDGRIPVPNLTLPYEIPTDFGGIPPFVNIGPTDQNGYAESPLPLHPWSIPRTYCVSMVFTWDDSVCVTLIDQ